MQILETVAQTFDTIAFALTLFCGLLTIMLERYLYSRRGYKREARISAFLGWFYVLGGSVLYLSVSMLKTLQ